MTEREWDIRVAWLSQRRCWWWNAWRARTSTELYGFADSRDAALRAMTAAMKTARVPEPSRPPCDC